MSNKKERGGDSDSPIPSFDPVRLRYRHDGWTAERQNEFIAALAESGCVLEACARVGKSSDSAYALRRRPDAISFRNAWECALDYAVRRIADNAFSRCLRGVVTPIFFQGEQVGERRRYDERLTMFLLRYRDPLRYGKWNDNMRITGHHEGPQIRLAQAMHAILEDEDLTSGKLSMDEMTERIRLRLMEYIEEAREADNPPDLKDYKSEDYKPEHYAPEHYSPEDYSPEDYRDVA